MASPKPATAMSTADSETGHGAKDQHDVVSDKIIAFAWLIDPFAEESKFQAVNNVLDSESKPTDIEASDDSDYLRQIEDDAAYLLAVAEGKFTAEVSSQTCSMLLYCVLYTAASAPTTIAAFAVYSINTVLHINFALAHPRISAYNAIIYGSCYFKLLPHKADAILSI